MKTRKRNISIALLFVFCGLSIAPLFSKVAPPNCRDTEIRIVAFEESDDSGVAGLLRTASESQEENSRPNDFIFISFLKDFHSVSDRVLLEEVASQENNKRPTEYIYLLNSSLTI